jgi:hypothetical protein
MTRKVAVAFIRFGFQMILELVLPFLVGREELHLPLLAEREELLPPLLAEREELHLPLLAEREELLPLLVVRDRLALLL